jgi:hypothetical protein
VFSSCGSANNIIYFERPTHSISTWEYDCIPSGNITLIEETDIILSNHKWKFKSVKPGEFTLCWINYNAAWINVDTSFATDYYVDENLEIHYIRQRKIYEIEKYDRLLFEQYTDQIERNFDRSFEPENFAGITYSIVSDYETKLIHLTVQNNNYDENKLIEFTEDKMDYFLSSFSTVSAQYSYSVTIIPSKQTNITSELTTNLTTPDTTISVSETLTTESKDENIWYAESLFDSLVSKDAETFNSCDIEISNEQIFDLTQIDSIEILSTELEYNSKRNVYRSIYKVNIKAQNSSIFPSEISTWQVIFDDGICTAFVPSGTDLSMVYSYSTEMYKDPRLITILDFCYSMNSMQDSHNSFETIENFDDYFNDNIKSDETFIFDLSCFAFIRDVPYFQEDDNCVYSYGEIESIINENFVCNLDLGNDDEIFSGQIWKRFEDNELHFIINEIGDDYIEITYYADSMLLIPAKRIRYNFAQENENYNLSSTECIDDFGFMPCFDNPLI